MFWVDRWRMGSIYLLVLKVMDMWTENSNLEKYMKHTQEPGCMHYQNSIKFKIAFFESPTPTSFTARQNNFGRNHYVVK